jgi:hypothetical protein
MKNPVQSLSPGLQTLARFTFHIIACRLGNKEEWPSQLDPALSRGAITSGDGGVS